MHLSLAACDFSIPKPERWKPALVTLGDLWVPWEYEIIHQNYTAWYSVWDDCVTKIGSRR